MLKFLLVGKRNVILLALLFFSVCAKANPHVYLFLDSGPASQYKKQLEQSYINGAQIIYSWKSIEPKKDRYNFTAIEKDLKTLHSLNKLLFIQIQDKSFSPQVINVPNYLLETKYAGGIAKQTDFQGEGKPTGEGWVAKQWVPAVQQRFQKLLRALGKQFDGEIAGINLTETSIDLNEKKYPPLFTCNGYFNSVVTNMKILRSAFHKSAVVQYVNFFPCEWNNDHRYMSQLFDYAIKYHIGLGGPDAIPYRRGQMKNSYPFFHRYKSKLTTVAFAIQEPDYTYLNPKTKKHFTVKELYEFANNYLGANIIFWNIQEPEFSKLLLPFLSKIKHNRIISKKCMPIRKALLPQS